MSQPKEKVIFTAKRKIDTQAIRDLTAQMAQYSEKLSSLEADKEKATGSIEHGEEALRNAIEKYSATAEINSKARQLLRQAEQKIAQELQRLEQEHARAVEEFKSEKEKRENFEDMHAKEMNDHKHNVAKLQKIAERKLANKAQLIMYQTKRDELEEKLARTVKELNEQLNSSSNSTRTESSSSPSSASY